MGVGLEIFKNSSLEGFWNDFLSLGLEFLENNFLEARRLLDQFFSLGLELLKNSSLEVFWSDFWAWT